ncbi:MAG: hypothetical protein L3J45_04990 [Flavobacteriaceae bacterium]|nr:hypothetical protein [Flavobacteriaceae bacterium]
MKTFSYIFICACIIQQAVGQNYLEKSVEVSSKNIEIYLNDIDNLILRSTKAASVDVHLQDFQENKLSAVKIDHRKNSLVITSAESYIIQEQFNKFCVEQPVLTNYIITVPNNSNVNLKIGKGNLSVIKFKGNLNAEVDTGEVLLNNILGNVTLFIVDGVVRVKLQKGALDIKTNLGKIISTLPVKSKIKNTKILKETYESNLQILNIRAIKANIYLDALKD